jgi:hypothetical protein
MIESVKEYSTRIKLVPGESYTFPDFTLAFTGQRPVPQSPAHVPLGDFYDFKLTANDYKEAISWSSGTGEIAPARFRIPWGSTQRPGEIQIDQASQEFEVRLYPALPI